MARIATRQETVLERIVARLVDQITQFGTANCYISATPNPTVERSHNLFCQVSPGGGRFDEGEQRGAANFTPFEQASTWVTVFSRIKLDRPFEAIAAISHSENGLLVIKRLILKALTGHDLLNASGDQILIAYITPISSTQPEVDPDGFASVSIVFDTPFEWDLVT